MNDSTDKRLVARRQLIRGAGVLGSAAVITAATAPAAHASDGDDLVPGEANQAAHTTGLTVTAGTEPTLTLANAHGPQLHLSPSSGDYPILAVGDILNLSGGPLIGIDDGDGAPTTILVTGADLPYAVPRPSLLQRPQRLLDTRQASGRSAIVRTSDGAINKAGQLVAGQWLDLQVGVQGGRGLRALRGVLQRGRADPGQVRLPHRLPTHWCQPAHVDNRLPCRCQHFQRWCGRSADLSGCLGRADPLLAATHVVLDVTGDVSTAAAPDSEPATPRVRALTRAARATQARRSRPVRRR